MKVIVSIIILLMNMLDFNAFSQKKTVEHPGIIKGTIRDSVYNHAIKSATITVYNEPSGEMVNYQVSNNVGDFTLRGLPVSASLKVVVSNIGYNSYSEIFTISPLINLYDFKTVFINVKTIMIEEVSVAIPPMQMNGDTLEFNAGAFKLDSNAVVQDLMKRIPNITQWGDGKITVNGREIKSLLVNGKEFMGGDSKIAIENIPKNALEKIQVYNTLEESKNLQDSSLNMNLKLKKGKDFGFFGKFGIGYGTNRRFESDASLNIFSPKLQLSLVASSNNVNKISNDISTLLRNSTYKGVGVQLDYMPDFRTAGINQPRSVGYNFSYDFVDKKTKKENQNIISSEYFLKSNLLEQENKNNIKTTVNNQVNIIDENISNNSINQTDQSFNLGYQYSKDRYRFTLFQNINLNNTNSNSKNSTHSSSNDETVSKSSNSNKNENFTKSYGLKAGFNYRPNIWDRETRFSGLFFNYAIDINSNTNNRESTTIFESMRDSTQSKYFNRSYDNNSEGLNQEFNVNVPNIIKLLIGVYKFSLFEVDFNNNIQTRNNSGHNSVVDYNRQKDEMLINDYLTNHFRYNSFQYAPELKLNKSIVKSLTNRFDKTWSFSFNLKNQLYYQANKSDKDFQNIDQKYYNLLPGASISFSSNQYGDYRKDISVNYSNEIKTPTMYQLAPLTDSINVYFLRVGNLDLKEEKTETINIKYKFASERKDNFEYNLSASYSTSKNSFVNKIIINQQNVRTVFTINNSDNYQYNLYGSIKKGIKLNHSELQIQYNVYYNFNKSPSFINDIIDFWYGKNLNNSINVNYAIKSNISIEGKQSLVNSFSNNSSSESKWSNKIFSTSFSVSYNMVKSFVLNSNISMSKNISSGSGNINYNIWNASASYRMLKGNNLEMKLSALDILRQNTSIVNYNRGGVLTIGSQNVLQQYFMLGLSYYPRKFGK
ncbi:TonB-dependent receptor [Sphingobacterium faecium]|uniref:TonB-dependent receptor n=1 Tax=Sphingobacterium faecium TaxID=34087 RepID=UPI003209B7E0